MSQQPPTQQFRPRHPQVEPTQPFVLTGVAGPVPMSGSAACSFTLGIMAMLTFGLFGIPAIVCGMHARRKTRTGIESGNGLAAVGMMLGWLSVSGWLLVGLVLMLGIVGGVGAGQ